jgi:hypothetical protein
METVPSFKRQTQTPQFPEAQAYGKSNPAATAASSKVNSLGQSTRVPVLCTTIWKVAPGAAAGGRIIGRER